MDIRSASRNRYLKLYPARYRSRFCSCLIVLLLLSSFPSIYFAQDARELEAEKARNNKLKGEHPLIELMRSRNSKLRPELMGVHPRVYVTDKEIDELRQRARTTHRELWQLALRNVRALTLA